MTTNTAAVGARLGIAMTLEFKDAAGNMLKRMPMSGSVPLAEAGMSVEQAQQIIDGQTKETSRADGSRFAAV